MNEPTREQVAAAYLIVCDDLRKKKTALMRNLDISGGRIPGEIVTLLKIIALLDSQREKIQNEDH